MLKNKDEIAGHILKALFLLSALFSIAVTAAIILNVLIESIYFFRIVPISDFLLGLHWSPQIATRADQVGSSGALYHYWREHF